jgi:hypothetical protein
MTNMNLLRRLADLLRRPFRPLASIGLLLLAPKCFLCLLAYAGIGAAFGLRRQEICGAPTGSAGIFELALTLVGAALAIWGLLGFIRIRRNGWRN